MVAEGEIAQLVALVEHVVADGHVDDDRQHNACPNGQVVGKDAQLIVRIVDPAPQLDENVRTRATPIELLWSDTQGQRTVALP